MWNMKCIITPVMTGATGIATKALNKNLKAILGKHSIYEGNSISKLQIQVATYVFELSAGNFHR